MKILIILLFSTSLSAKCINQTNDFVGKGVLTFGWFIDLYEIAYYQSDKKQNLKLHFKRDISISQFNQGWDEGLKRIEKSEKNIKAINWLKKSTVAVKEDDCVEYKIVKGREVQVIMNSEIIAKTTNKEVRKLIHYSWIGEIPVDEDLKSKLLGAK